MPRLTITDVRKAADALREAGEAVTVISIRKKLGHGSFSTVSRLLKELQKSENSDPENIPPNPGKTATKFSHNYEDGRSPAVPERPLTPADAPEYLPEILAEKSRELERLRNRELELTGLVRKTRRDIAEPLENATGILRYFLKRVLDEGFASESPGDLIRLLGMLREPGNLHNLSDYNGSWQEDAERLMRAMVLRNRSRPTLKTQKAPQNE